MNQCPKCTTRKKADNCIICYLAEKKRREEVEQKLAVLLHYIEEAVKSV